MNINKILADYTATKEIFTTYKQKEAEQRIELLSALFPNGSGSESTVVDNLKIKAKFGLNYKLSIKDLDDAYPNLTEEEQLCIIHKPSLVMRQYNSLEDEQRNLLDSCITISPAMPSLSIEVNEE